MLFSCIEKLIPGLIALFFAGMGMVLFTAATNTLIQTLVQDEKRGRIMSLYSMIMRGLTSVDWGISSVFWSCWRCIWRRDSRVCRSHLFCL